MPKGHGERMSRKQSLAIAALLDEPTILAAAARIRIHERTLRAWLADADFLAAFGKAAESVLSTTKNRLMGLTSRSLDVLARNLDAEKPADQLKAAELVLSHAVRLADLLTAIPMMERILENQAAEKAARNGQWSQVNSFAN